MRAVVTVVGKDMVGILSKVAGICAENKMNVIEVSQTILQDMFCMIMLVETADESANFAAFAGTRLVSIPTATTVRIGMK